MDKINRSTFLREYRGVFGYNFILQ